MIKRGERAYVVEILARTTAPANVVRMSYAVENALFQWEEGERRLRDTPEPARSDLERAVRVVIDELRRRLGSSFSVHELAAFYARDVDWASELAQRQAAGTDSPGS